MKKLIINCNLVLALFLLLASYSCSKKENTSNNTEEFKDRTPENVHLSSNTNSSITVSWDEVGEATGYSVQLLDSKDGDKPIERSPTIFSATHYDFNGLEEDDSYYARVRAHFYMATSDWVYIMNKQERARIIPKYGIVDEDFEEPEIELYPNFPEGWEIHTASGGRKPSFTGSGPTDEQSDIFPSGEWLMENIYSISTASMEKNRIGDWALLFRGGYAPYLEMNFDLPDGASMFSFYYGAATQNTTDTNGVPITVKVEYSQDSGNTWTSLGEDLIVASAEEQYFQEYELNFQGPVRFRIGKDKSEARLFVDEIAVYKN